MTDDSGAPGDDDPPMAQLAPTPSARPATSVRWPLPPTVRRWLLVVHIALSVALLGEISGFLAVAIRAHTADDPAFAAAAYDLLAMFSLIFGIPLSFGALLTGIALGVGTKWGVLRYPWVMLKLGAIVSVILVGALILGPSVDEMRHGDGDLGLLIIAGAAWDVLVLGAATGLSVFKPGRRRQRRYARRRSWRSTASAQSRSHSSA